MIFNIHRKFFDLEKRVIPEPLQFISLNSNYITSNCNVSNCTTILSQTTCYVTNLKETVKDHFNVTILSMVFNVCRTTISCETVISNQCKVFLCKNGRNHIKGARWSWPFKDYISLLKKAGWPWPFLGLNNLLNLLRALYKDISNYSNFRAKIYGFFLS